MHRKTTENAVFTRNFEFIDPLRSFDRNMVFNYTNLTIRKGLYKIKCTQRKFCRIGNFIPYTTKPSKDAPFLSL